MEVWDTVNVGPTVKEVYPTEDGSAAKVMYQGWDPGETHKVKEGPAVEEQKPARVVQNMVDQSAFFGWCTDVRGTNAGLGTMELIEYGGQNPYQQHEGRDHQGRLVVQDSDQQNQSGHDHHRQSRHQQQGGHRVRPEPATLSHRQQACRVQQHLRRPHLLQAGRPPEGGYGYEDKYDDIGLEISFRNRFKQNPSVLDRGGASLVARCRLYEEPDIVYCRATFRYHTWAEVHACTDTLVDQPPYLVTRGWGKVVPGFSYIYCDS